MQHNWYLNGQLYYSVQTSVGETSSSCRFTGLSPSTRYSVSVRVFAFNPWRELDSGSGSAQTDDAPLVSETYYAKLLLNGNGGKVPSGATVYGQFTGWGPSWSGGADIDIDFHDPGFSRSGWTLIGWSRSSSATHPEYEPSDSISIYSTRTNENNPATVTLYAVWSSNRPDDWHWQSNVSKGSLLGLTASEWNGFIDRIKEFAAYKGVTLSAANISAGQAEKGTQMKAKQANAVRALIRQLSPGKPLPEEVLAGDTIIAAFANGLKDSLNSIT